MSPFRVSARRRVRGHVEYGIFACRRTKESTPLHSVLSIVRRDIDIVSEDAQYVAYTQWTSKNSYLVDRYDLIREDNKLYTLYYQNLNIGREYTISGALSTAVADYCKRNNWDILSVF